MRSSSTSASRYAFSGPFIGGYREIPLRAGEAIDRHLACSRTARAYRPGGCAELGCDDAPGTFGDSRDRQPRPHRLALPDDGRGPHVHGPVRLRGLAVAYDDVVDVNLQVWGDEWEEPLGRLTATETAPGKILRAWGHPVYVRGDVQLDGKRALLRALDVPAGQFVELRTVIPRSAFTSTAGMKVVEGNGLAEIVAEEQADAAAYERDRERIDNAKQHPWRYALWILLLGDDPGGPGRGRRVLVLRPRAPHRLRPRVRAGAADRHRACARPDPAPPGRRGGLVRVHRRRSST